MICREMIGRETDWKALEPEIRGASVEEIDTFFMFIAGLCRETKVLKTLVRRVKLLFETGLPASFFQLAVVQQTPENLDVLLETVSDINETVDGTDTLLTMAVKEAKEDVFSVLHKHRADFNRCDENGLYPVDLAGICNSPFLKSISKYEKNQIFDFGKATLADVRQWIKNGGDVNAIAVDDGKGHQRTLLQRAVLLAQEPQIIKALLDAGAKDENHQARFCYVVKAGKDLANMRAVLKSGMDVNGLTPVFIRPLFYALRFSDNPAIIKAVLEAGADVHATEALYSFVINSGFSALKRAVHDNKGVKIVKTLLEYGNDFEDEALSLLCTAVLQCPDLNVFTALCDTVKKNPEKMEVLEEKMKAAYQVAVHHKLPIADGLILPIGEIQAQIVKNKVKKLIENKETNKLIEYLKIDAGNETALQRALMMRYPPFVIMDFIDCGEDVNVTQYAFGTILMLALRYKYKTPVIRKILDAGARINETTKDNLTAFYQAIKSDANDKTLKLLLARGANPDIKTEKGQSARDIANEHQKEIIEQYERNKK